MSTASLTRVAIVDADRRVQSSLAEVLRAAGVSVVGTAGDVRGALELIEDHAASVLVIDPRLPELDAGQALLSSIRLRWPEVRVVLMGWADPSEGGELTTAAPYVTKSALPEDFVTATVAACNC
jgi:DNA-binding NarL/FixJ family response regulator